MGADMEVLPGKKSKIPIEKKYDQTMEAHKSFFPIFMHHSCSTDRKSVV